MRKYEALRVIGGLSNPSKMPGKSYGLPASACKVGSILRDVKGSVCSDCYACKGCYQFPSTVNAQARRLEITLSSNWDTWVEAFTVLMGNMPHFRWHDSGDLQSVDHLEAICQVARNCPDTMFWLPTKEVGMVRAWMAEHGGFGPNLNVRLSAPMVGKLPVHVAGTTGSAVNVADAFQCPAPTQDGECRECRACWDQHTPVVSYKKH